MTTKPSNQDLTQAANNLFNSTQLNTLYEQFIDASFVGFGRDITLVMPPAKTLTESSTFNPLLGGQDRRLNQTGNVGDKGYTVTPIEVIYKAHIKHGPAPLDRENAFTLNENEVATTTVYDSITDIETSVCAIIDGKKFRIGKGPRPIGFSDKKYVITIWNRVTDGP